jgi:hypothetical protein
MVVPGIPVLAAGAVSPGERLDFGGGGGWLIGWRGRAFDTVANTATDFEMAVTEFTAFFNSGEQLLTNGQGVAFGSFANMFADSVQWSPLLRYVRPTDVLNFNFRNVSAAATVQPSLMLAFVRDGDFPGGLD